MEHSTQQQRGRGKVRWFNDSKGFGFITPDNGGTELFVHHSSIKSDGYRTLAENAVVEFTHSVGTDGRPKAIDVTGPNGADISDSRSRRSGGGFRDSRDDYGGACYQCCRPGHIARDCPENNGYNNNSGGGRGSRRGGNGGECYQCHRPGHLARDCPENGSNYSSGSGGGGRCYNCQQPGHFARECRNSGSGGGGGGGGGVECYTCGRYGHIARDCDQSGGGGYSRYGGGSGGGGRGGKNGACYNCGDQGHFARECTNRGANKSN